MGIIYKITNKINGKVYIGLTTTTLENRWNGHKALAKKAATKEKLHPLYNAMLKYGIENFDIVQIDSSNNFKELGNLERKYIDEYKSFDRNFGYNITMGGESNQLDANPRAKLTVYDVKNIRKIYNECIIGCKECWKMYSDRISFSAFEKIFEGTTWKSVMPEVYTEQNKLAHRKMGVNYGEKNVNAILTSEQVYNYNSKESFRAVIDVSYSNIPKYSKIKNRWYYENDEKRVKTKNNIRTYGDIIEIDTFDDYGNLNGTFITDIDYIDIIKEHKWNKNNDGKLYTINKNKFIFLHNIITESNKKTFYINNSTFDVRKNNLTNDKIEYKVFQFGVDNFNELVNKNIPIAKISKITGISRNSLSKYIKKLNNKSH